MSKRIWDDLKRSTSGSKCPIWSSHSWSGTVKLETYIHHNVDSTCNGSRKFSFLGTLFYSRFDQLFFDNKIYPLAIWFKIVENCFSCTMCLEHLRIYLLSTFMTIYKYPLALVQANCLRCAVFLEHLPQQTGPRDTSWLTRWSTSLL